MNDGVCLLRMEETDMKWMDIRKDGYAQGWILISMQNVWILFVVVLCYDFLFFFVKN